MFRGYTSVRFLTLFFGYQKVKISNVIREI